jgi:hypothetical protein
MCVGRELAIVVLRFLLDSVRTEKMTWMRRNRMENPNDRKEIVEGLGAKEGQGTQCRMTPPFHLFDAQSASVPCLSTIHFLCPFLHIQPTQHRTAALCPRKQP